MRTIDDLKARECGTSFTAITRILTSFKVEKVKNGWIAYNRVEFIGGSKFYPTFKELKEDLRRR